MDLEFTEQILILDIVGGCRDEELQKVKVNTWRTWDSYSINCPRFYVVGGVEEVVSKQTQAIFFYPFNLL